MSKSQHAVFQILNDKKPSSQETIQKKEGALRAPSFFNTLCQSWDWYRKCDIPTLSYF